ncbi:MAG: MFS transporter [Candidatus Bathyarchaeia archaeon]
MPKIELLRETGLVSRSAFANIVSISNVFVWYSFAFSILKGFVYELASVIWGVHFLGAAFSAIAGAAISDKISRKTHFLLVWMMFGIISSLILIFVDPENKLNVVAMAILLGISFGIGIPTSMGQLAYCAAVEDRAKIGGLTIFVYGLGAFFLGIIAVDDITLQALTLAIWRAIGLIIFLLVNHSQNVEKRKSVSFRFIFNQRSFCFYFIPWTMFSLVNYLGGVIAFQILNESTVNLFIIIENVLIGTFAIVAGFLADTFGRKRITIIGFVMLGLGYAVLGIYPENLVGWYFYTIVDGVAWGIFWVIFIITIWGDLSYGMSEDKYYAIGGLPFYMSNFLRILIGPYIAKVISVYAMFSFAAFFLFLAVIPLMFAPETLPEKKLRERELRQYVEKARKIKEKFT